MATSPEAASTDRKRERQRQLDALAVKAVHEQADAAVEVATSAGVYASLCSHAALVAIGAWLLMRGGSLREPSMASQAGSVCLLIDAFICMFVLAPMLRTAQANRAVRGALIATAAVAALTALPTVFVSLFGPVAALPFRPILYFGKGGLWMLALLGIVACYGAASAWLAWRLSVNPAAALRALAAPDEPS